MAMPDPFKFVTRRYETVGFDGLTENQKLFYAVDEVCWSDWVEYFCEGLGDDDLSDDEQDEFQAAVSRRSEYALAGLKTLGAKKAARLFKKAMDGSGDWITLREKFLDAEPIEELLKAFAAQYPQDFGSGGAQKH
jgi:hypothetical protein